MDPTLEGHVTKDALTVHVNVPLRCLRPGNLITVCFLSFFNAGRPC